MNLTLDTTKRAARMLEAGRVTVTFTSPSGQHITITAKSRAKIDDRWQGVPLAKATILFFEVPNHDNGFNDKVGKLTGRGGFVADRNADPARVYCAKMLLAYVAGRPTPPSLVIQEENRCGKCGRELTDPVSIERGIGPECYGQATGSSHQQKRKSGLGNGRKALVPDPSSGETQLSVLPGSTFKEIFV
jgi:hypothetical protein